MTPNVEIARGEIEDAVELGRTAFGRTRADYRMYLEWKYLQNPYRSDPLLYVARDSAGEAVAMRGFYGARWSTPSGTLDMPCADDFVVTSRYQGTGIATALMRHALADLPERGVRHVVNASGGEVTVLHSLASGWKSVVMVDPLDREAVDGPGKALARLRATARPLQRALAGLGRGQGVTSMPDVDQLAALSEHFATDGSVRHVRDAAFFLWRYANPQREYRFLVTESGSRLTGYLVVGRQRPRPDTLPLYFADWAADSAAARRTLLERAVEVTAPATTRVWAASLPDETRSDLDRLGFKPAQHELRGRGMPCVLFKALEPGAAHSEALQRSVWNVRLIDSMHG